MEVTGGEVTLEIPLGQEEVEKEFLFTEKHMYVEVKLPNKL